MAILEETIKEMDGYKLHVISTEKFKTNTLVWKMKAPLQEEDLTERALLPYVLQSNTRKFPSTAKLRTYLDDLYGANLYVDLAKKGEYHIISISIEIANEKFLSDQTSLLRKGIELLAEILTNPNVKDNAFDQDSVEKEKRTLKQRIQSIYDDKMKYANNRLIEEMCRGELYALNVYGDKDKVDAITPKSLYDYYQKAFAEDELDLYIVGNVCLEEVSALTDEFLTFPARSPKQVVKGEPKKQEQVREVKEEQDVKQGKLNMGYRTNIVYGDKDYFSLQVFNGIFGGFPHSKLFINVREKASLAYYAASRLESHKGLLIVMSGIDSKNFDQAVSIIHEQMDAMKSGDFSDEIVEETKAVIINQLLETIDTSRGIVEVLYHNVISDKNISLETWMNNIGQTSKEDIIRVAKNIELDTIYFLTGTEAVQS